MGLGFGGRGGWGSGVLRFWGVESRGGLGVEGVGAFRALGFTAGSTVTCSGNTAIAQGWPFSCSQPHPAIMLPVG